MDTVLRKRQVVKGLDPVPKLSITITNTITPPNPKREGITKSCTWRHQVLHMEPPVSKSPPHGHTKSSTWTHQVLCMSSEWSTVLHLRPRRAVKAVTPKGLVTLLKNCIFDPVWTLS